MNDTRILDLPGQREQLIPLSVQAYHALGEMGFIPEKTELIHGFVFQKMPKSPLHRALILRMFDRLLAAMNREKYWLQSEQPITCGESEPEPDLSVIAGCKDDFFDHHPTTAELVIEVAVTSQEMDRAKARIYATAGVKEYWLVDVPARLIEIHLQPSATGYADIRTVAESEIATSSSVPEFSVSIAELLKR